MDFYIDKSTIVDYNIIIPITYETVIRMIIISQRNRVVNRKDKNMKEKEKAAIMNRLTEICNNSISQRDICLSAIAICMLHNVLTDEKLNRCSNRLRSQCAEADFQDQLSSQKSKENSID